MDKNNFSEIYKKYVMTAYSAAMQAVHNEADADDIAQETMVKLYLNIDALDEDRVEGWVRVAAKNLGIDYQRKAQRFDWNELDEDLRAEEMELPTRSGSRLAECFLLLLSESLFLCIPSVQSPVQPEAVSGKSTIPSGFGRLPLLFPQTDGLHWRQALCFHMPQMYTSSVRVQKRSATAEEKSPSEQAARPELPLP